MAKCGMKVWAPSAAFLLKCGKEKEKLRTKFRKQLQEHLLKAWEDEHFSDIAFSTSDLCQLYAHQALLKIRVPNFLSEVTQTPVNPGSNPPCYYSYLSKTQLNPFLIKVYTSDDIRKDEFDVLRLRRGALKQEAEQARHDTEAKYTIFEENLSEKDRKSSLDSVFVTPISTPLTPDKNTTDTLSSFYSKEMATTDNTCSITEPLTDYMEPNMNQDKGFSLQENNLNFEEDITQNDDMTSDIENDSSLMTGSMVRSSTFDLQGQQPLEDALDENDQVKVVAEEKQDASKQEVKQGFFLHQSPPELIKRIDGSMCDSGFMTQSTFSVLSDTGLHCSFTSSMDNSYELMETSSLKEVDIGKSSRKSISPGPLFPIYIDMEKIHEQQQQRTEVKRCNSLQSEVKKVVPNNSQSVYMYIDAKDPQYRPEDLKKDAGEGLFSKIHHPIDKPNPKPVEDSTDSNKIVFDDEDETFVQRRKRKCEKKKRPSSCYMYIDFGSLKDEETEKSPVPPKDEKKRPLSVSMFIDLKEQANQSVKEAQELYNESKKQVAQVSPFHEKIQMLRRHSEDTFTQSKEKKSPNAVQHQVFLDDNEKQEKIKDPEIVKRSFIEEMVSEKKLKSPEIKEVHVPKEILKIEPPLPKIEVAEKPHAKQQYDSVTEEGLLPMSPILRRKNVNKDPPKPSILPSLVSVSTRPQDLDAMKFKPSTVSENLYQPPKGSEPLSSSASEVKFPSDSNALKNVENFHLHFEKVATYDSNRQACNGDASTDEKFEGARMFDKKQFCPTLLPSKNEHIDLHKHIITTSSMTQCSKPVTTTHPSVPTSNPSPSIESNVKITPIIVSKAAEYPNEVNHLPTRSTLADSPPSWSCDFEDDSETVYSEVSDVSSSLLSMSLERKWTKEGPEGDSKSPRSLEPCSKLGEDLLRMFFDEINTDIIIQVEGKEIKAHRCILASRCKYFAAMLKDNWIEAESTSINLQGFSFTSVHFALCHIYSGAINLPSNINLAELTLLADMLALDTLKEVIVFHLKMNYCHFFHKPCSQCLTGVPECLVLATACGLQDLRDKIIRWLGKHFTKVWSNKAFAALPADLQELCYQSTIHNLCIQNIVDTTLSGERLLASLPHVKWTEPVFGLVGRLLQECISFMAEGFDLVLESDGYLALGKGQSWNVTALEDTVIAAVDLLQPDVACRSLGKLNELIYGSGEWTHNFSELLHKITRQIERYLIHNANRVVHCKSWALLSPDVQRKIKDAAVIVFEFEKPTAPPPRLSSLNRKSNKEVCGLRSTEPRKQTRGRKGHRDNKKLDSSDESSDPDGLSSERKTNKEPQDNNIKASIKSCPIPKLCSGANKWPPPPPRKSKSPGGGEYSPHIPVLKPRTNHQGPSKVETKDNNKDLVAEIDADSNLVSHCLQEAELLEQQLSRKLQRQQHSESRSAEPRGRSLTSPAGSWQRAKNRPLLPRPTITSIQRQSHSMESITNLVRTGAGRRLPPRTSRHPRNIPGADK